MVKLTVDPRGMSLFRWCRLAADWRIFAVSFSRVIRLDLVQLASVCGSWWVSPTRFCSDLVQLNIVLVFLLMVSVAVHIVFSCIDGSGNGRRLVIYGAFCSMWHITQ
ncbi:unnamed protein product [Brassica rapa]|uniref:Uncharacterized protein n=2 Tax=Brassica TaxID=3705 RepID=A0A3P5YIV6_BRACM|nr:unnamed protein product [Brassica napus]CAG7862611.1 unnamed protein product [Brassica rapa]VDC60791.1 unnamed protein product [Brassica rapa]